jgi:hypothetical protein
MGVLHENQQMYLQADHTMQMIRALPRYSADDLNDAPTPEVRVACLEAFFMHVRAITDFRGCRVDVQPKPSDFSARDLVADWQARPADAAGRLADYWVTASTQIAHFSRDRIP